MRNKLKISRNRDMGITQQAKQILDQMNEEETIFLGSFLTRKGIE